MSTAYTYPTLKAAVIAFIDDQGTEFATAFDTVLPLAEDKVLRDLDLEIFDMVATGTTSGAFATKPTGFVSIRTLHYATAAATGTLLLLEPRSYEFIKDYWPTVATTTTTPKYYADYSDTQWIIGGTPATALTWTARYIKRPTAMTSGNPTTWLGTNVGDLLWLACLMLAEQFTKADERKPMWEADYADRLKAALGELKPATRADYMPLTTIPTVE